MRATGTERRPADPVGGDRAQPEPGRQHWAVTYAQLMALTDCIAILIGLVAGLALRTQVRATDTRYDVLVSILGPAWLLFLAANRSYEARFLGIGQQEFRWVADASVRLFASVVAVDFLFKEQLQRSFVLATFGVGTGMLLLFRYAGRRWLHHQRRGGSWSHRLLVVGDEETAATLIEVIQRDSYVGFQVVGACVPAGAQTATLKGVPIRGTLDSIIPVATQLRVDAIAVAGHAGGTAETLRSLSWELEGTGIDLIIAPALTDVAGPRIMVRPVAGLPLLHLEEPTLGGLGRVAKTAQDRLIGALALLVLSPLLLLLAVLIRLDSPGPIIFRQTRVGREGKLFQVYKLRSMVQDAEQRLPDLAELNEADPQGRLFKVKEDPRVTRVGAWIRRWSLDELPQLWNVLRGDMALVGPRPPLPSEVERYERDHARRLLVKPGMTGLWQVSGRSSLSWDDSVRLDLYYVENWSLALDAMILWKTLSAVLRHRGAY